MNTVLSSCVFAAVAILAATGAPTSIHEKSPQKTGKQQENLRVKRSNYAASYISPCAAASAPVPAYAPAPYQLGLGPVHHQAFQPPPQAYSYLYGYPQYRTEDEDEMMGFSDMEPVFEHPMARYAYAAPSAAHYGAPILHSQPQSSAAGTVFSVFPNANADTGSVALLLSCSPSISSGHIVNTQPVAASGAPAIALAPPAYREMDEPAQAHEEHPHEAMPQTNESNAHQT